MSYVIRVVSLLALAGLPLTLGSPITGPAPPTYAVAHSAAGFILLPYAKLTEPFKAKYDPVKNKSRIDYYDETMKTFQIATQYSGTPAQGAQFKIVWNPNWITHQPEIVCYQKNATEASPVKIQSVVPDLKEFKYEGKFDCANGTSASEDVKKQLPKGLCEVWALTVVKFNRTSSYRFYAQEVKNGPNFMPVRYTMFGYNTLFGSHFDEYEMIYTSFVEGKQDDKEFDVLKEARTGKCLHFEEDSGLSSRHLFNPMGEFVFHEENHLDEHFTHFKTKYDKAYNDEMEESARKNNFRHNLRLINSLNRKNTDFALRVNHLADRHSDELRRLRSSRKHSPNFKGTIQFQASKYSHLQLPDEFDWRTKGVVSEVKDQAICGSCWSFGTAGHLESIYALKHNKTVLFSEQQLIDCSWKYGNNGCNGGEYVNAFNYIIDHGLHTADSYNKANPYLGIEAKCHDDQPGKTLETLQGYANVTGVENLKTALVNIGPIAVYIDAKHESFAFYSHGIYTEKDCKTDDLNHAVLLVGYGSVNGTEYWIIKNSWSTHWGDEGYLRVASAGNLCGVATAAAYAVLP